MPPNIGFSYYLLVFLMKFINNSLQGCLKVVRFEFLNLFIEYIFYLNIYFEYIGTYVRVPPNFFTHKGCREPKKVENTALECILLFEWPLISKIN